LFRTKRKSRKFIVLILSRLLKHSYKIIHNNNNKKKTNEKYKVQQNRIDPYD